MKYLSLKKFYIDGHLNGYVGQTQNDFESLHENLYGTMDNIFWSLDNHTSCLYLTRSTYSMNTNW